MLHRLWTLIYITENPNLIYITKNPGFSELWSQKKGDQGFGQEKNIFRLRASNYDGNIYSYKSSHSPTQKVHSVKKN